MFRVYDAVQLACALAVQRLLHHRGMPPSLCITTDDVPLVASPGGEGPFQGKAIGENPISPVAPAIANAVDDAVGVRIQDLPITAEKVLVARTP